MHRSNNAVLDPVGKCLDKLKAMQSSPLDFLSGENLSEKLIDLFLSGVPTGPSMIMKGLEDLARAIEATDTADVHVLVFGGGTGLSNIVGGDSRSLAWTWSPFHGVKEYFPQTGSVVCITDDGGSTGELLKELPIIALGDLRHVLLSSIQHTRLASKYALSGDRAFEVAGVLYDLFNHRFKSPPGSPQELLKNGTISFDTLPPAMQEALEEILDFLFQHELLKKQLERPHCLGNLILAAAIYKYMPDSASSFPKAKDYSKGLNFLAEVLGASPEAVLPCTATPASLQVLYANGVMVTGEYKSGHAQRHFPMDRIFVEFSAEPEPSTEVIEAIGKADIILFAPGSLYTSILPIMQVPDIAEAIRRNRQAMKVLVANLWIQKGETDIVRGAPQRRFYTSDLINAYHRNIPGGIKDLFNHVMVMKYQDIPGSILQNYGLEDKAPIYFDRREMEKLGIMPIETKIFSQTALEKLHVVQHDPLGVSKAVKALWAVRAHTGKSKSEMDTRYFAMLQSVINPARQTQNQRLQDFENRLAALCVESSMQEKLMEVFWQHKDILLSHLNTVKGIETVERKFWKRSQLWDKIFSFYDPEDGFIKIRSDVLARPARFEMAFLVALGQSLLGNYVESKQVLPVEKDGVSLGQVYEVRLRSDNERLCFFNHKDLDQYLRLSRMNRAANDKHLYTRLINETEGFTPPGMLMGLTYAWYLDNRLSAHVEYKMTILRTSVSGLIPEQVKKLGRRRAMIDFFRKVVFQHDHPVYSEKAVVANE
jgi:uncharacterized cofD-like protein